MCGCNTNWYVGGTHQILQKPPRQSDIVRYVLMVASRSQGAATVQKTVAHKSQELFTLDWCAAISKALSGATGSP